MTREEFEEDDPQSNIESAIADSITDNDEESEGDNPGSDSVSVPADSITNKNEVVEGKKADENENIETSRYPVEYINGRRFVFVRTNLYPAELLEYFDKLEDKTSDEYKEAQEISSSSKRQAKKHKECSSDASSSLNAGGGSVSQFESCLTSDKPTPCPEEKENFAGLQEAGNGGMRTCCRCGAATMYPGKE